MQKLLNTFPILSFVPVAANVAVVVAVGAPVAVAVGADADKIFLPTTQN